MSITTPFSFKELQAMPFQMMYCMIQEAENRHFSLSMQQPGLPCLVLQEMLYNHIFRTFQCASAEQCISTYDHGHCARSLYKVYITYLIEEVLLTTSIASRMQESFCSLNLRYTQYWLFGILENMCNFKLLLQTLLILQI